MSLRIVCVGDSLTAGYVGERKSERPYSKTFGFDIHMLFSCRNVGMFCCHAHVNLPITIARAFRWTDRRCSNSLMTQQRKPVLGSRS